MESKVKVREGATFYFAIGWHGEDCLESKVILLVEDNAGVLELTRRVLQKSNAINEP